MTNEQECSDLENMSGHLYIEWKGKVESFQVSTLKLFLLSTLPLQISCFSVFSSCPFATLVFFHTKNIIDRC